MTEKITSFVQLRTWQEARKFAVMVYQETQAFPETEKFGLVSQIRRSTVSVAANIAEGFSRSGRAEKVRFYSMALGSLTESLSHAYISADLGYMPKTSLKKIEKAVAELHKMINGIIKSAQGRNT